MHVLLLNFFKTKSLFLSVIIIAIIVTTNNITITITNIIYSPILVICQDLSHIHIFTTLYFLLVPKWTHSKLLFLENKAFSEKPRGKVGPCPWEAWREMFWRCYLKTTHNLVFVGQPMPYCHITPKWARGLASVLVSVLSQCAIGVKVPQTEMSPGKNNGTCKVWD